MLFYMNVAVRINLSDAWTRQPCIYIYLICVQVCKVELSLMHGLKFKVLYKSSNSQIKCKKRENHGCTANGLLM